MKTFICAIVLVITCFSSWTLVKPIYNEQVRIYKQENKCIDSKVAKGIERELIIRTNGSCEVK